MKEQEILKSKVSNIKLISSIILITGIILGFIIFYAMLTSDKNYIESAMCGYYGSDNLCEKYENMSLTEYMKERNQNSYWIGGLSTTGGFLVLALVIYLCYSKQKIIITNKRVYGKSIFGKVMNLPLDSISAVELSMFKGILISTSSGRIKFKLIENNQEVYKEISKLLMNRQNKDLKEKNFDKQNMKYTDELKELKELLDSGIINQEEFDKKKKQLLNL